MLEHWILDENKNHVSCDLMRWAKFLQEGDRHVKFFTTRDDSIQVSTVFVGIDMGFGDEKEPLLYETMIFCKGDKLISLNQWQERYSTRAQALQGHRDAIRMVIKKLREDKNGETEETK